MRKQILVWKFLSGKMSSLLFYWLGSSLAVVERGRHLKTQRQEQNWKEGCNVSLYRQKCKQSIRGPIGGSLSAHLELDTIRPYQIPSEQLSTIIQINLTAIAPSAVIRAVRGKLPGLSQHRINPTASLMSISFQFFSSIFSIKENVTNWDVSPQQHSVFFNSNSQQRNRNYKSLSNVFFVSKHKRQVEYINISQRK